MYGLDWDPTDDATLWLFLIFSIQSVNCTNFYFQGDFHTDHSSFQRFNQSSLRLFSSNKPKKHRLSSAGAADSFSSRQNSTDALHEGEAKSAVAWCDSFEIMLQDEAGLHVFSVRQPPSKHLIELPSILNWLRSRSVNLHH